MPTSDCGFQLGLIPEKKWNWRTFAASYGMLTGLILFFLVVGVVVPDTLLLDANYHITELIPRPALRPERLHKSKPLHMKLLPPAPVFETPKLIVPHEVRAACTSRPSSRSWRCSCWESCTVQSGCSWRCHDREDGRE